MCTRNCPCQPVTLPASFLAPSAPRAPALGNAAQPTTTPLERSDPTSAWYDLATVVNVASAVGNLFSRS